MNRVILLGNIGSDIELTHTNNQVAIAKFSLATSKRMKGANVTTWHRIVVWGKPAETCAKHLSKGSKILLEGEIVNRDYTDKDGIKRYVSEVQSWSHVEFVGAKKETKDAQESTGEDLSDAPF